MQYPVDIHSHTIASTHAYSTISEYLTVAQQKGLSLFATTDHGPAMADAPHFWHFVNLRVLPRIHHGVGLLRGIEANIQNMAGEIDFYGDYLQELDIVLAGFHEPVFAPTDCLTHTKAMIATIESGLVDVITHPGNPAYPIEIVPVVTAAAAHNVALEINNSSFLTSRSGSKPTCLAIAETARDVGASLVMGSDAHIAFDLGGFERSRALLDLAQFPEARLLNRSVSATLDFLIARGHRHIDDFASLRE
ncbi:phosphatase [Shewanella sp. NIFS-20-20]|uniref:phosphatase n=1 Tax=Shewanella sp. NIFS-20-20 TaxID=2853806 RepID=UPI001C46D2D4|nr:phosphatase [Shewanella sp. NIFS-20-20]MBV7314848.1 phosphatase [Shewanella sp. NIFS-20-20]